GPALLDEWREAHHEMGGFIEAVNADGFTPLPIVMAWATPSGPVVDGVLEEITARIIDELNRHKPDGLLLALHGAMVAESHLDADGEIVSRIRAAMGPKFPFVVTLDLHGNISQRLVDGCTAAVAYRTNPHVDQRECGRRAASLLARTIRGEVRPTQALAKPPMIVNIMVHDTSREPLRDFMDEIRELERQPGILAASLLPGFAYADVPQMGPSVIVVTDGKSDLALREANRVGQNLWDARERLTAELPDAATAVCRALASDRLPVVLVDTGD